MKPKKSSCSKKKAETSRKAKDTAKKAGAGLSAAYLASYKYATPYVNTTADLAKDLGNDAAKFVKPNLISGVCNSWGYHPTNSSESNAKSSTNFRKKNEYRS